MRRNLTILVVAALASLFISACTMPTATAPSQAAPSENSYRLAAGDRLRINTFGQDDLSGEFDVDSTGYIAFPLLGQIPARGRTIAEVEAIITQELNRSYIVDPQVNVEVINYRPFFILGQVNSPGSYDYTNRMTVLQAVALAGGYTRRAKTSSMTITRVTDQGSVVFEAQEATTVLPGDTVEIVRRLF